MSNPEDKKIITYSIKGRPSKVTVDDFAKPPLPDEPCAKFMEWFPDILAGKDIKEIVESTVKARKKKRGVIVALGGHVIKCGLAPVLNSLIEKDIITALAVNGACLIHDFEIALFGKTSEDVAASLHKGTFGMAEETGALMNQIINQGVKKGMGFAESIAHYIGEKKPPYVDYSLLGAAWEYKIPITAHIAIGTDIIHMHPEADGARIGEGSMRDFYKFTDTIVTLDKGGVYFNIGSAVILPEVFLKAISIVLNKNRQLRDFITVNLDFIQHYRPLQNVVTRPTLGRGKGYSLTGHHELLIPILAAAILAKKDF
ncbi:MAG: hypothetical protein ACMUJM_01235 [bacterium]